jgi:hypothetical protein
MMKLMAQSLLWLQEGHVLEGDRQEKKVFANRRFSSVPALLSQSTVH